jgi:uncharacterized protein YjbI with pentapeptide repeats
MQGVRCAQAGCKEILRQVDRRKRKRSEITMANQQQLDLLKQGVATTWNMWREEHPNTPINLNGVDLSEANLGEVNLAAADLSAADLREANLSDADLSGADLAGANLRGADLREAQLNGAMLEGALITTEQLSQAKVGRDSL